MVRTLVAVAVVLIGFAGGPARAELTTGTMLQQSNADQASGLLPPEILKHYKGGDYMNQIVDFPNGRFRWDDGFDAATRQNGERIILDESKAPVDKTTMKQPEYLTGLPFPDIREDDPDGGYKALWNLAYAYYTGGNSRNWTILNWLSRTGVQRAAVQDVYFLYYDGQPRQYTPKSNPENLLFQFLAVTATPSSSTASRRTSPGRSPATRSSCVWSIRTASPARWSASRSPAAAGGRCSTTTTRASATC